MSDHGLCAYPALESGVDSNCGERRACRSISSASTLDILSYSPSYLPRNDRSNNVPDGGGTKTSGAEGFMGA